MWQTTIRAKFLITCWPELKREFSGYARYTCQWIDIYSKEFAATTTAQMRNCGVMELLLTCMSHLVAVNESVRESMNLTVGERVVSQSVSEWTGEQPIPERYRDSRQPTADSRQRNNLWSIVWRSELSPIEISWDVMVTTAKPYHLNKIPSSPDNQLTRCSDCNQDISCLL